jgi:hypothetical protein
MPRVIDGIGDSRPVFLNEDIHDETLGLPSDFSSEERSRWNLGQLAILELALRESEALEAVEALRNSVKALSALHHHKKVHLRGQEQNTWSLHVIRNETKRRNAIMSTYNAARKAILYLAVDSRKEELTERYPPLSVADTFRKPPEARRAVGDSRRPDGHLWSIPLVQPRTVEQPVKANGNAPPKENGWIWKVGSHGRMTDAEVRVWEEEGA